MKKETIDARAGQLLRQSRHRANLYQSEVSATTGLPQSTISAYESSNRQPTVPMLSKLLEASGFELMITAAPLPKRLLALTGPTGLRVRRHRKLIVQEALRVGVETVRVIGAVARAQDQPGDAVELMVEATSGPSIIELLMLRDLLAETLGIHVILRPSDTLGAEERADAYRTGVLL